MSQKIKAALLGGMALILATGIAIADENRDHDRERGHEHERPPAAQDQHGHEQQAQPRPVQAEPHPGPSGYQRHEEPQGWNVRPQTFDRPTYQRNYQASRGYAIGPYHNPNGWQERRWRYGEFLPPAFWSPEYILTDYWLFGLEVPPMGYEWIRIGHDAALVFTMNGEILQVVYDVFS